jgi:chorismate dehydratase
MPMNSSPRVSVVQYLNTVPLIWGMMEGDQRGKYELTFTTPAQCADAVRSGQADIGIIPSIEYQRMDHAQILAGLAIASKSEVKSVLLFSKVPIEEVKTVALDHSSRTSAALLRVLMRKFYSRFIEVMPAAPKPEEMLKRADAAYNGTVAEIYDLAAEWKKFTGLPFVFALWVGHERAGLARLREDFLASRDFGLQRVDDIAAEYAPRLDMKPEGIKVYLTENIDYSLDEENREGLRLFFRLARETGIVPVEKELNFA